MHCIEKAYYTYTQVPIAGYRIRYSYYLIIVHVGTCVHDVCILRDGLMQVSLYLHFLCTVRSHYRTAHQTDAQARVKIFVLVLIYVYIQMYMQTCI